MNNYFEKLREYITANPPDFGDGDSVLRPPMIWLCGGNHGGTLLRLKLEEN